MLHAGNEGSTGGPWQVFELYCPLDKLSTIEIDEMIRLAATVHEAILKAVCLCSGHIDFKGTLAPLWAPFARLAVEQV